MSRIIVYVDNAEVDNLSYSFSGDFVLAGRSPEIADRARKIQMLLELLLEQLGENPILEIRRRSE